MVIFTLLTVLARCDHYRKSLIASAVELLNIETVAPDGERTRLFGLSTVTMSVTTITVLIWPLI